MRVVCGGHFWQFASLAAETTDGEILSSYYFDRFSSYRWGGSSSFCWPKHGLKSDLRVANFKGGACPQTLLACSHLSARNGRTSLK